MLSMAIMHGAFNERRRACVEGLVRKIGVKQIQDLLFDFTVVQDWHKQGPWPVARECWTRALESSGSHHLVLQDDATICEDFLEGCLALIAAKPDNPISLYSNRKICEKAKAEDARWVMIPDGTWGVAMILPKSLITEFLDWSDRHIHPTFRPYDSRLAMFCVKQKIEVFCPTPSLADHEGHAPSLIGNDRTPRSRTARWFIGGQSPLDLDWKGGKELRGPNNLSSTYWKHYRD